MVKTVKNSITLSSLREQSKSLGEYMPTPEHFAQIEEVIQSFREESFLALSLRKRFRKVNQILCQLIQAAPPQSFLLSAILDYLDRVNHEKILLDPLTFASFEFWLNNFSELSEKENYEMRAKIVGKWIPRGDYQAFFPIGMDRIFAGTHFVAAHLSPDVDTMIASFWGWIDAFAARVGTSLHLWSLPGGPPDSPITSILREMFGKETFTYLARTAPTLTLNAMDLATQQQLTKELGHALTGEIDHGINEKSILLVDEQGHYLGDWRSSDVELVRQIIISFKSCLRWFENNLHTNLISLLARPNLSIKDLPVFYSSVFDVKIKDCEPALEFNERQKNDLDLFFSKILGVKKGLEGTFGDLNQALAKLSVIEMAHFQAEIESMQQSDLFDASGKLKEDRPKIFNHLDKLINNLDDAIHHVRNYVERLDVVVGVKHQVLGLPRLYVTLRSDVDEIRQKMGNYDFLTVVVHERDGSLFPVGIVRAVDLRKNSLGSVSFRDFCNQDEIKMASYLEIVSIIDHHKSSLKTTSVPLALIGDAQSCNVLIAEKAFELNDRYGLGNMTLEEINQQIEEISSQSITTLSQNRILQRLLNRRIAAHNAHPFFIHPHREFNEYLCFLHAILDDTDLLTKVSYRDVKCVAQLVNRLKSLASHRETEVVHLDDIPRDTHFAKVAAQRILQHPDMYSLYKKIYDYREADVESNLKLCAQGKPSSIFLDTKEQNGCARVGQTKMFASNFSCFFQHVSLIRKLWLDQAQEIYRDHPEIDLHLHMISTIANAEEVYHNQIGPYKHQDEIWFWIPPTQQAIDHLSSFLASFQYIVQGLKDQSMWVELLGPQPEEYKQIFTQNFLPVPIKAVSHPEQGLPVAVLHFKAGTLNSRKSTITPAIPRLVP